METPVASVGATDGHNVSFQCAYTPQRSGGDGRPPLERRKSAGVVYTPHQEDKLCRKLKFFFMGPHEKVKAKRRCPWKLLIQIVKIILVTSQVRQTRYVVQGFHLGGITVIILSFQIHTSEQTVQTQIRLLLKEQSDQGLHCLLFHLHLFDELP